MEKLDENLLTDNPEAKPLFKDTDMKKQQQMLLPSLVFTVEKLLLILGIAAFALDRRQIFLSGVISEGHVLIETTSHIILVTIFLVSTGALGNFKLFLMYS